MAIVPRWYVEAARCLGVCSSADVAGYFTEAGFPDHQSGEAWCAAFVGAMLHRAKIEPVRSLIARSYLAWGVPTPMRIYSVVVLYRPQGEPWQGHVGFVQGFDGGNVRILGGNQSNCVNVRSFPRSRVLGTRWPDKIGD